MKFTEEQAKKFYRGSLIKKINAKEQKVVIEVLDANAIEQINSNVLKAIKDVQQKDAEGNVYNTSYIFDREGKQIGKHRKVHLFDIDVKGGQTFKESDTLTAGDSDTVFDTEFGKIGVMLCFDIRFPELSRMMVNDGAKVIFVPAAFNMTTGPAHWELSFRTRALDNQIYMVGCAPARDVSAGYISWGHSIVTDPWGRVTGMLDENEGILLAELDMDYEEQVREELPLLKSRRKDIYQLSQNLFNSGNRTESSPVL